MEGGNFLRPVYCVIWVFMTDQEKTVITRKGKRGPAPTGKGVLIGLRLQPDLLEWLDTERAELDPEPSRPEMIRRILENARR